MFLVLIIVLLRSGRVKVSLRQTRAVMTKFHLVLIVFQNLTYFRVKVGSVRGRRQFIQGVIVKVKFVPFGWWSLVQLLTGP